MHINHLLEEHEIGVLLGTTALLLGIVSRSYQVPQPHIQRWLPMITISDACQPTRNPDQVLHCHPGLMSQCTKLCCLCIVCQGFEGAVPKLVAVLQRLRSREVGPDYTYYGIASPWLQARCMSSLHGLGTKMGHAHGRSAPAAASPWVQNSAAQRETHRHSTQVSGCASA